MRIIRMLRNIGIGAVLTASIGVTGLAAWSAASPLVTVEINANSVTPGTTSAAPGQTVMFINHRSSPVRIEGVGLIPAHSTLQKAFAAPGQYRYSGFVLLVAAAPVAVAPVPASTVLGVAPAQPVLMADDNSLSPVLNSTPGLAGNDLTTSSGPLASPAIPGSTLANDSAPDLSLVNSGPLASPAIPSSSLATNPEQEELVAAQVPGMAYAPLSYGANLYGAPYESDGGKISHTGISGLQTGGTAPSTLDRIAQPAAVPPPGLNAGHDTVTYEQDAIVHIGQGLSPLQLTVYAGTNVTFVDDVGGHGVHSTQPMFDSGELRRGEQYRFAYPTAGRYTYHISGGSSGTIVVVPR